MNSIQRYLLAGARIILHQGAAPQPCFVPLDGDRPLAMLMAPPFADDRAKIEAFVRVGVACGHLKATACAVIIDAQISTIPAKDLDVATRPSEDPAASDALICLLIDAKATSIVAQEYHRDDLGHLSFLDPTEGQSEDSPSQQALKDGFTQSWPRIPPLDLETWLRGLGWGGYVFR